MTSSSRLPFKFGNKRALAGSIRTGTSLGRTMKSGAGRLGYLGGRSVKRQRQSRSSTTGLPSAGGAGALSETDIARALSAVEGKSLRKGRRVRCFSCGVQFPVDEMYPELDEEGRRTGWVCDSCY